MHLFSYQNVKIMRSCGAIVLRLTVGLQTEHYEVQTIQYFLLGLLRVWIVFYGITK